MLCSVFVGIAALLTAMFLPSLLLEPAQAEVEDNRLLLVEQQETSEEPVIKLLSGDQIIELPLESYLIGVVAAEMPMSFHEEALKAQAVTARTFTMRQMKNSKHKDADLCDQSNCCQAWFSPEQLKEKLGNSKKLVEEKAVLAVASTEGKLLTYENELIDAVYFSCSGGMTESAASVWGSDIPYLQQVESPGEENAPRYMGEVLVPYAVFREKLSRSELSGQPSSWFGDVLRTESGGVSRIEIGGEVYSGTEIRSLFRLNSTVFDLAVTEDGILFETKGFGHRVGMSQYGANAMAQEGYTYDEILSHYYPGTKLQ